MIFPHQRRRWVCLSIAIATATLAGAALAAESWLWFFLLSVVTAMLAGAAAHQ